MKCIFLLSGDYIKLAEEEIFSLFELKNYTLNYKLMIADVLNDINSFNKIIKRLALTKRIYKLLFKCEINDLIEIMKNFDWNSVYRDNFCLRIKHIKKISSLRRNSFVDYSEKNLAGYVWRSLTNPKVNLKNPKTRIDLFFTGNRVYCCVLIKEISENFESRKAHLRPFPHPSSLHPRLARALVNITEIKDKEILLDPFCGTGGFLIESGLMGIKVIGYDINKFMIRGCENNLKNFNIKDFKIFHKNALKILNRFDCIVTDLPYGLNSNVILKYSKDNWKKYRISRRIQNKNFLASLENFYLLFLKNLRKRLKKKAVIIFPDYVDYKKLLKTAKFKIEREFSMYVHRSLTRKVLKISN